MIKTAEIQTQDDPILWHPPALTETQIGDFIQIINRQFQQNITSYQDLHDWSVADGSPFWQVLLETSGIRYQGSATPDNIGSQMWPRTEWFPHLQLNFAENMLKNRSNSTAIIYHSEHQAVETISFNELHDQVAQMAAWMRQIGINSGDVVAGLIPNCPEAVVATLAAASIGAIWTACSPDSGIQFAADRFTQTMPKLLISVDGYIYDGKPYSITDKIHALQTQLPSLVHTIIIQRLETPSDKSNEAAYAQIVSKTLPVPPLSFTPLNFSHPIYILYSSGTTGKPKCLVHTAGGTLLQHIKEHRLQCDLRPGDRLFYYTTTSWMMWNWLISGLASNLTIVLFEGKPDPETIWKFAHQAEVTAFGTSASWISLCQKMNGIPTPDQVAKIRLLLSTGSTLLRDHYDFIYSHIKSDIQVASISGGTDIVSCFAGGGPVPVRRGRLQCAGLGMAVEVWDETGKRIFGEQGELVCTRPFPCMPIFFLNDLSGQKYRSAYFERFKGIWTHGDCAIQYEDGSLEIVGRSDSTIKHHGVRIGTGDLYNILETLPFIKDSLVVGKRSGDDENIIVFVVMKDNHELDAATKKEIRVALTAQSPWFKPDGIFPVSDIPCTTNGKKSEILVKNLLNGKPATNLSVIRNPECLPEYERIAEQLTASTTIKRSRTERKSK